MLNVIEYYVQYGINFIIESMYVICPDVQRLEEYTPKS